MHATMFNEYMQTSIPCNDSPLVSKRHLSQLTLTFPRLFPDRMILNLARIPGLKPSERATHRVSAKM